MPKGMTAYGWSPSGSSLLLSDGLGNLYVADPFGSHLTLLPGLPKGQGLSNAWWLTDTTVILERGDPGFEISTLDLASHQYLEMPRQSAHKRYVQLVSPTGEWWLEYDNTSGHLESAFPDGSTKQFIQGLDPVLAGPTLGRLEPQFAVTSDARQVFFTFCSVRSTPRPPGFDCAIATGAIHNGQVDTWSQVIVMPQGVNTFASRLSSDNKLLFVGDRHGEQYLIYDLVANKLVTKVSWEGLRSDAYFLSSPVSNQLMAFENRPPISQVSVIDGLTGVTGQMFHFKGSLMPLEWHRIEP